MEGEVSTAVAGASVTVGWEEVTEMAGTVMPMDSSIDLGMVTASILEVTRGEDPTHSYSAYNNVQMFEPFQDWNPHYFGTASLS